VLLQAVVIITDGHSDSQTQTIIQANFMKLADIKIVCVGIVRRLDRGYLELQQIATDPEEVVRLQVDSFSQLAQNLPALLAATCPPTPPPGLHDILAERCKMKITKTAGLYTATPKGGRRAPRTREGSGTTRGLSVSSPLFTQ